jgi:hypothetical protein
MTLDNVEKIDDNVVMNDCETEQADIAEVKERLKLGSAQGSVVVRCDLTAPTIDEPDWNALR